MAPTPERAFELIRLVDDGQGWSREDRVVQRLGGGVAAVGLIHDLAASGDIIRELQTWSMLNDNYEPTGEPHRVHVVRVTQARLIPRHAGASVRRRSVFEIRHLCDG